MTETSEKISKALVGRTFSFSNELQLHDEIGDALRAAGFSYQREKKLGKASRVDFGIVMPAGGYAALEVKTRGSGLSVTRQLLRYLEHPAISEGIVVSSKPMTLPIDTYTAADGTVKPVSLVGLWNNALL